MMVMDPYPGFEGKYFSMPCRNVVPEAGAEAAPAAVGGLLQPRHHPPGRAARHRRADLRLHRSRARRGSGSTTTTRSFKRGVRADRPRGEPQHRHGDRLLLPRGRARRRAAAAPTASASSSSRSATTTSSASTSRAAPTSGTQFRGGARAARHRGARRRRRRHRHAGRAARAPARASRTPASTRAIFIQQGGKNRHEHICESLELFASRRDAGVPRARGRAREAEAEELAPLHRGGHGAQAGDARRCATRRFQSMSRSAARSPKKAPAAERQKQNAKLWANAAKVTLSDPARHGSKTSCNVLIFRSHTTEKQRAR